MVRTSLVETGPQEACGAVPAPESMRSTRRREIVLPLAVALALVLLVVAGLLRDPFASEHARLAAPSLALPFGADASGRDLLARVGHGALSTLGTSLLVVLVCLVLRLVIGLFPHAATGPVEVANAVALVGWAPLAAHAAALGQEARARPFVKILPVLGVGPARILFRYVLPAILGPVFRHAMLRIPGIALALASLGFLGLGPRQPTPEWGLILAEGINYVERAPWTVAAPAAALVLTSVLAVSLSGLNWTRRRGNPGNGVPIREEYKSNAPSGA